MGCGVFRWAARQAVILRHGSSIFCPLHTHERWRRAEFDGLLQLELQKSKINSITCVEMLVSSMSGSKHLNNNQKTGNTAMFRDTGAGSESVFPVLCVQLLRDSGRPSLSACLNFSFTKGNKGVFENAFVFTEFHCFYSLKLFVEYD